MASKRRRRFLVLTGLVIALIIAYQILGWASWMITGYAVDAETGDPIEGAAVTIRWDEPGPGPPGLAGHHQLEYSEDMSDHQGRFRVLKYSTFFMLGREYEMAVYKQGYVFWSSEKIFPTYDKRMDFSPNNGMVIRLQPFKEQYSRESHAVFATTFKPFPSGRRFNKAMSVEADLSAEVARRNRRK